MSTLKCSNLQNASAASPAIVLDANSRATLNGLSYPTEGSLSGRNRIINGDMRIDQRNAGAAVTATTSYPVDRTRVDNNTDGAFSAQQSTTAPAGFTHSLACTITTADTSLAASQYMFLMQIIEGNNIADLDWGKATAKSVTVSFWVRSSVTGNFGGCLANDGNNRSYPFTYSISAANTWEYKTITIPGDTSGTWLTTNGAGIKVIFSLGAGSTYKGAASTWTGSLYFAPTSSVDLVGTLNATFYLTGVQLEAGSTATPFERRSYGQELALCQRYFETATGVTTGMVALGSTSRGAPHYFKVSKRATPTITYGGVAAFNSAGGALSSPTAGDNTVATEYVAWMITNFSTAAQGGANITASAEL